MLNIIMMNTCFPLIGVSALIIFFTSSCKNKDETYDYFDYVPIDSIIVPDTLVGPDFLVVVPSKGSRQAQVEEISFEKRNDTIYVKAYCHFCNECYQNTTYPNSFCGERLSRNYVQGMAIKSISQVDFDSISSVNYIAYVNTEGILKTKSVFVTHASSILKFYLGRSSGIYGLIDTIFPGDTVVLSDSVPCIEAAIYYYSPIHGIFLEGKQINRINAAICTMNGESRNNFSCGGSTFQSGIYGIESVSHAPSYNFYDRLTHITEITVAIGISRYEGSIFLDGDTFQTNFWLDHR